MLSATLLLRCCYFPVNQCNFNFLHSTSISIFSTVWDKLTCSLPIKVRKFVHACYLNHFQNYPVSTVFSSFEFPYFIIQFISGHFCYIKLQTKIYIKLQKILNNQKGKSIKQGCPHRNHLGLIRATCRRLKKDAKCKMIILGE